MSERHHPLRLGLILGLLLLVPIACGSGSSQPEKVTVLSSEVTQLLWQYEHMRELGRAGQADSFMARRDSVTSAFAKGYYSRANRSIDSGVVWRWAADWPDVAGLPLIQDTTDGQWRRLTFVTTGARNKKGQQMMLYPIIMFRKEDRPGKSATLHGCWPPNLTRMGKRCCSARSRMARCFVFRRSSPTSTACPSTRPAGPRPNPKSFRST